jgi:hypothetical protein
MTTSPRAEPSSAGHQHRVLSELLRPGAIERLGRTDAVRFISRVSEAELDPRVSDPAAGGLDEVGVRW